MAARDFLPPWTPAVPRIVAPPVPEHDRHSFTNNDTIPHNPAMITSGFTNAPVSRFLVFSTVIGALAASLTDTRYYLHIQVVPHLWNYGQLWRLVTWQVRYVLDCSLGIEKADM